MDPLRTHAQPNGNGGSVRSYVSWRITLVLLGVCALAGVSCVIALSQGGTADAIPRAIPVKDSPDPSYIKKQIRIWAKDADVITATLREVAGVGEQADRAGLFVGTDDQGRDYVSIFTSHSLSALVRVTKVMAHVRDVAAYTASEPDSREQVGAVKVFGIASPRVARVTIDQAGGKTSEAALVECGHQGFSYFTYTSSDSESFPTIVRGFGSNGKELITRDISYAATPPPATNK
jgi:hypothetical protein